MNSITLGNLSEGAKAEPSAVRTFDSSPPLQSRLGFSVRLTAMIVALVLASVLLATGLVYVQYRQSLTDATIHELQGTGEMMAESFTQWLDARQDEIRYVSELEPVRQGQVEPIAHLLERMARGSDPAECRSGGAGQCRQSFAERPGARAGAPGTALQD